jgi:alpha-tubulin suppressor-like RCC1 family protein
MLALDAGGSAWAWGNNWIESGGYTYSTDFLAPERLSGLPEILAMDRGDYLELFLDAGGDVWSRGDDGLEPAYLTQCNPIHIPDLPPCTSVSACGIGLGLGLADDGTVWYWGYGMYPPRQMSGLSEVVSLAQSACMAVTSDGTAWSWTPDDPTPVPIGVSDVIALASYNGHNFSVTSDGSLWAWGFNHSCQLGDGTRETRFDPVRIEGLPPVAKVAPAYSHTLAVARDGSVWVWGDNTYSQLGEIRPPDSSATPVAIRGLNLIITPTAPWLMLLDD